MSEPKFSWELLAGHKNTIDMNDYEKGFEILSKRSVVSAFPYMTSDQFEPKAELFFKKIATQQVLRDHRDKYSGNMDVISKEDYINGWNYIQTEINRENPHRMDMKSITKADFEKYVLVTKYYEQYRFKLLPIVQMEYCMKNNFIWTWSKLNKYLECRDKIEGRTEYSNYEGRYVSEIEKNRKISWHHLFSDEQLDELKNLIIKYFRRGTQFVSFEQIFIEDANVRKEFGKIIYDVARQNGFEYDEEMDENADLAQFLPNIDRYMHKLCPQTFNVLKTIPDYWLLISKQELSEMAITFKYQVSPDLFIGTNYLKEKYLKMFLDQINSGNHDHELSREDKEAISVAIYTDVEQQSLNIDHVLGFSTSNPYLVWYTTHP
jgi:hypothetical protein